MAGYITENELSVPLKDKINKGTADKIELVKSIGSISTNVQDALENIKGLADTAYNYAVNGKKNIAGVIGAPASSNNTFAQLQSYIQTSKNTLATNLTNKGVAARGGGEFTAISRESC